MDLTLLDLRPSGGGEHRANCPYCSDRGRHLYVNPSRGLYNCFRCGRAGRLSGAAPRPAPVPAAGGVSVAPATDHDLDRAYRALLAALPLSSRHETFLLDRGFPPDALRRYGTLPSAPVLRYGAADAAARSVGAELAHRVPGLFRARDGQWTILGSPGLLVPVSDRTGLICGVQVRADDPPPGCPRYTWLSGRRHGGAPARARLHWAYPPGVSLAEVWVTEGPLKADYAAFRLGLPVLAVPGVTACRGQVLGVLADLQSVVVAFDADLFTNPHVRRSADELARACEQRGVRVSLAVWPPECGKGLDDLLRSGGRPVVLAPFAWMALLQGGVSSMKLVTVGWARVASEPQTKKVPREGREDMHVFRVLLEIVPSNGGQNKPLRLPATAFYRRADEAAALGLREGDTVFVAGSLATTRQPDPSRSGWQEVTGLTLDEIAKITSGDGAEPVEDDGLPY